MPSSTPNTNPAAPAYSAAQIAAAVGVSKRRALQVLADMPSVAITVNGQLARGWGIDALPEEWRAKLQQLRVNGGFRSETDVLREPWQSPVPLSEVAPQALERAGKLQCALAPSLAREADTSLSAAEFERLGVQDYRETFGHSISTRHWRRLFVRTKERDRNRGEWDNLALYLEEHPPRRRQEPAKVRADDAAFSELLADLQGCATPAAPNEEEQRFLWIRAFEVFEERLALGVPARVVRPLLVDFLWRHVPSLAGTKESLRVAFTQKLTAWIADGRKASALMDKRHENSGWHRRPKIAAEVRDKLIATAVLQHGGNVAAAWRQVSGRNELPPELASHYLANPRRKSYVPHAVRGEVAGEVRMLEDIHHGPRRAKLNGAHIDRDWSGVFAMEWFSADDVTLDLYYYEPDGKGWFTLMRGQCLVVIDVRSLRVLGYCLISARNYNAFAIRTLFTKAMEEHGLPTRGFYLENGIWKKAKLIKGDTAPLSLNQAEQGLREFGLEFVHSRLPRSKPVELVIGRLQARLKGDPGYCGRDEVHDGFERMKKLQIDVDAKRLHPAGHFYGKEEWLARLDQVCADYNAEPQEGKLLNGLSPDDAFEQLRNPSNPPSRFPASLRYLLAHHRRPVTVTKNGVTLRFGTQPFTYRDEQTGPLIGQRLLAWFNPECPEAITLTDNERRNPITIARAPSVPAMNSSPEQLAAAHASIAAHSGYATTRYRMLRAKFQPRFRTTIASADVIETGEQIAAQRAVITEQQRAGARLAAKARSVEQRLGVSLPPAARRDAVAVDAADELADLLKQHLPES